MSRRALLHVRKTAIAIYKRLPERIRGPLYLRRKRLQRALAAQVGKLIAVAPSPTRLFFARALLRIPGAPERLAASLMSAGEMKQALLLLRYKRRRSGSNCAFLYTLGQCFYQGKDYQSAIAALSRAVQLGFDTPAAHFMLAHALLRMGRMEGAYEHARIAAENDTENDEAQFLLAHCQLATARETEARHCLALLASRKPGMVMAHQNEAGRYARYSYRPPQWEMAAATELMPFDCYNRIAEWLVQSGEGLASNRYYLKALQLQRKLTEGFALPAPLRRELAERYGLSADSPFGILPYEWTTQIGHIAMLDTFLRMVKLGMVPDVQYLILAPDEKVANRTYLDRWHEHFTIVRDERLIQALFPYQRHIGYSFSAFLRSEGDCCAWTDAGAEAHRAWDLTARKPFIALPEAQLTEGWSALHRLGLPKGAWFAGLHVREGGYHHEIRASGQMHRNASIADYLDAVSAVAKRGGWVVRLGDRSMRKMPPLPNVIDYPHSKAKSTFMDVFLCAAARFIIGTTSGLSNVAISFGTPMVLVNCVSNFWQLWNRGISFTLKPILECKDERPLRLPEMIDESFRWKLFDAERLRRDGYFPTSNDAIDIRLAVEEKLDCLDAGRSAPSLPGGLSALYESALGGRAYFGSATPSPAFFDRHRHIFFG